MTFKVNYGFQKAERDRAKQAKKEAKRREKEAARGQAAPGDGAEDGQTIAEGAVGEGEASPS